MRLKSGQSKLVIGNLFLTYYHMTKLRLAMTEGIGREKAYGMGMITLMRIR